MLNSSQEEKMNGLTIHQNEEITEALCRMIANGLNDEEIKSARELLVSECLELNKATGSNSSEIYIKTDEPVTNAGSIKIGGHAIFNVTGAR